MAKKIPVPRAKTQMGFLDKSKLHSNKSEKGHFDKAGLKVKKILKEFASQNFNENWTVTFSAHQIKYNTNLHWH